MPRKDRLVYSTGPEGPTDARPRGGGGGRRARPAAPKGPTALPTRSLAPERQAPRVRRERSGRKGKTVTVVEHLVLDRDDATALLKQLKRTCGGGGTLKPGVLRDGAPAAVLELQGDHADRVVDALRAAGYDARRAGG